MNQKTNGRAGGKAFHTELHRFCERWRPELTLAELIAALESEKFFQLQTNFQTTLSIANFIEEKNGAGCSDRLEAPGEIARALQVDPATIRRWARAGCPRHIIGKNLIRYRLSEVMAWLPTRNQGKSPR